MATPVDGPYLTYGQTWGSKFGFMEWGGAEATTDEGSLLFTGGGNWGFGFYGGYDGPAYLYLYIAYYGVRDTYVEELTGRLVYPYGQGLPPTPPGPGGRYEVTHPPIATTSDFWTTPGMAIDNATFPASWRDGVEGVEGFTSHGPALP